MSTNVSNRLCSWSFWLMLCYANRSNGISWVYSFRSSCRDKNLLLTWFAFSRIPEIIQWSCNYWDPIRSRLLLQFSLLVSLANSQRCDNAFNEINDFMDQFHWYRFPIEIKRILPITRIVAQQPAELGCFGSFSCCRDTFKKASVCEIELI